MVNVLNVNNKPPQFQAIWKDFPNYPAQVVLHLAPNPPADTTVYVPQASDPDSDAVLVYSWSPGREPDAQGLFSIAKNSGGIVTNNGATFLIGNLYRLSIRVTDVNSVLPSQSTADIELLVYTRPQPVALPPKPFNLNLPENTPTGTILVAVDDGTCPLCTGPVGNALQSQILVLTVVVYQQNLYSPQFQNCPSALSIQENAAAGTVIGTLTATDQDDPELARTRLQYTLIPNTVFSNPTQYLNINPQSGVLTNANPLPYSLSGYNGILPNQLYFTVRVQDWGVPTLWSVCDFQLQITDVNNHAPVFDPPSYDVVVMRNQVLAAQALIQLTAYDLDDPTQPSGQVIYQLTQSSAMFSIDASNGILSMTGTPTQVRFTYLN
ncbi:hypothetical protein Ciccas_001583 [Cichlidogyrus casuarinus]|uniref:Cadherin domain-containing protein n=1 Tax=Cichlidogyrus casuarinus TaxID=1844966 RepID=A0ABD2QMT6_9PLAT